MAVFNCKMCGGDLVVIDVENGLAQCESCGKKQTLPNEQDERKAQQFNRANHYRRSNEFDRAAEAYTKILDTNPGEAEAYWGLVLCRYGIEYVEDKKTMRRIPTCHRTLTRSILQDPDYQQALACAKPLAKLQYEQEAQEIDRLQKEILALASKEDPFDIFISYKETDERSGQRTQDSVLAQDIYNVLTKEGYKVFFSRITLESRLGQEYEPIIYAALRSSKVMLAVGTRPEYLEAPWVRNEWSRYLGMMEEKPGSKTLIPVYRDMDPYDLPEEFAHLQGLNAANIGFMQDLVHGIEKLVKEPVPPKQSAGGQTQATVDSLLERIELFLESGQYDQAEEYCNRVLDMAPKDFRPYLYLSVCHFKMHSVRELAGSAKLVHMENNFQNALRFAPENKRAELIQLAASAFANAEKSYAQVHENLENDLSATEQRAAELGKQCAPLKESLQEIAKVKTACAERTNQLSAENQKLYQEVQQYRETETTLRKRYTFKRKGVDYCTLEEWSMLSKFMAVLYLIGAFLVVLFCFWLHIYLGMVALAILAFFLFWIFAPTKSNKRLAADRKIYKEALKNRNAAQKQLENNNAEISLMGKLRGDKQAEEQRIYTDNKGLLDACQTAEQKLADTRQRMKQLVQRHETSVSKARELGVI